MSDPRWTGLTHAQLKAEAQEWADRQSLVTRCALCDWSVVAPFAEARERFAAHRLAVHGPVRRSRRRRAGETVNGFPSRVEQYARGRESSNAQRRRAAV